MRSALEQSGQSLPRRYNLVKGRFLAKKSADVFHISARRNDLLIGLRWSQLLDQLVAPRLLLLQLLDLSGQTGRDRVL